MTLGDKKDSDKKEDGPKDGEDKAALSDRSEDKSESSSSRSNGPSSGITCIPVAGVKAWQFHPTELEPRFPLLNLI